MCFTCDEQNSAYSVGSYLTVPVDITDCSMVAPVGYWVNIPGDCISPETVGCTNQDATNYNPNATIPCNGYNGNINTVLNITEILPCVEGQSGINCCCKGIAETVVPTENVIGCTDPEADNYDPLATIPCNGFNGGVKCNESGDNCCCQYSEQMGTKCFWINTGELLQSKKFNEQWAGYFDADGDSKWFILPVHVPISFNEIIGNSTDCTVNTYAPYTILGPTYKKNDFWFDIRIEFKKNIIYPGSPFGPNPSMNSSNNLISLVNNYNFQQQPYMDGTTLPVPPNNPISAFAGSCGTEAEFPNCLDQEIWDDLMANNIFSGLSNCTMGLDSMYVKFPDTDGGCGPCGPDQNSNGGVNHYLCNQGSKEENSENIETIRLRFRASYRLSFFKCT